LLGSATAGIESFTKVIDHLAMRGVSLQPGQIVLTVRTSRYIPPGRAITSLSRVAASAALNCYYNDQEVIRG